MKDVLLKTPLFLMLEEIAELLTSSPKWNEICLNAIKQKQALFLLLFRTLRF